MEGNQSSPPPLLVEVDYSLPGLLMLSLAFPFPLTAFGVPASDVGYAFMILANVFGTGGGDGCRALGSMYGLPAAAASLADTPESERGLDLVFSLRDIVLVWLGERRV